MDGKVNDGRVMYNMPISSIMMDKKGVSERNQVSKSEIEAVLAETSRQINDATGITELFPDVGMAREILVSSILSPKDSIPGPLRISSNVAKLSGDIQSAGIMDEILKYFTTEHDIDSKLETILGNVLFDHGSYIHMYVPYGTLDRQIAKQKDKFGMESIEDTFDTDSMSTPRGILGNVGDLSAFGIESICDQLDIVKRPTYERWAKSNEIMSSLGLENYQANNVKNYTPLMLKDGDVSESAPMVYRVPSDSTIPVFEPGSPDIHLGYFVLLDKNGKFLSKLKDSNQMEQLVNRINAANVNKTQEFQVIKLMGESLNVDQKRPESLINAYTNKIEDEIKDSLRNGIYGSTVEVGRPKDVYRLMFARALAKENTRLLYVPAELMHYHAYSYDEMGIGESLLEKTKFIASLRAILLMSDMFGAVQNSMGASVLNVKLDEHETAPYEIVEVIKHEYSKMQTQLLPAGIHNPSDIMKGLQNGSVRLNVEGGDKFPGTSLTISEESKSFNRSDSELSDNLKKLHYNGFWLQPEIIDQALQGETATSILSNNLLLSKRCSTVQRWFKKSMSQDMRKAIRLNGILMAKIRKEVPEDQVEEFIDSIELVLPEISTSALSNQMEAFQKYGEAIEEAVEAFVSDDMLSDFVEGDILPNVLDNVRASLVSYFKRQWLQQQGILQELNTLYSDKDDTSTISKAIIDHNASIFKSIELMAKSAIKKEHKVDKNIGKVRDKLENGEDPDEEEGTDDGTQGDAGDDVQDEESGTPEDDGGETDPAV